MKQDEQNFSIAGRTTPAAVGSRLLRPVILEFAGRSEPYSKCLWPALSAEGAIIKEADYSGRWLLKNLGDADFVHFHWPSFFYADKEVPAVIAKALKFAGFLVWIRLRGVRIVWTAHNLYPHERSSPRWIDYAVRRLIITLVDHVFAHGRTAASILEHEFGIDPTRIVVIPHGHFLDQYPMQTTQKEARGHLGLPHDKGVFTFIGHCKRYKNVTELVDTFQKYFSDSWLVIAGRCPDHAYRTEIEKLIRLQPDRILFDSRFIDDAKLQFFIRAADAVVLPFKDVLTSGSAILALSFGRPVVAPRLGHLIDLVNEDVGVLYDMNDPNGLTNGMRAALSRHFDQETIMRYVASLRWRDAASTILTALRESR